MSYIKDNNVTGACLLGGEVFHQDLRLILNLVKRIKKETNKPIYIWTGFIWSDLLKDENKLKILNYIDVLVDGRFELSKRDLSLKFRGSSNQRVILVKESLNKNKVIEMKIS